MALWERARVPLGGITLVAGLDRVLVNARERFPALAEVSVTTAGIEFAALRARAHLLAREELSEIFRFLLVEFLGLLGSLTGEMHHTRAARDPLGERSWDRAPGSASGRTTKGNLGRSMTSHANPAAPGGASFSLPLGGQSSIPRFETGVRNLDAVLDGGLPRGSITVVSGPPGSGKTILAPADLLPPRRPQAASPLLQHALRAGSKDAPPPESRSPSSIRASSRTARSSSSTSARCSATQGLAQATRSDPPAPQAREAGVRGHRQLQGLRRPRDVSRELRRFTYELAVNLLAWECTTLLLGEHDGGSHRARPAHGHRRRDHRALAARVRGRAAALPESREDARDGAPPRRLPLRDLDARHRRLRPSRDDPPRGAGRRAGREDPAVPDRASWASTTSSARGSLAGRACSSAASPARERPSSCSSSSTGAPSLQGEGDRLLVRGDRRAAALHGSRAGLGPRRRDRERDDRDRLHPPARDPRRGAPPHDPRARRGARRRARRDRLGLGLPAQAQGSDRRRARRSSSSRASSRTPRPSDSSRPTSLTARRRSAASASRRRSSTGSSSSARPSRASTASAISRSTSSGTARTSRVATACASRTAGITVFPRYELESVPQRPCRPSTRLRRLSTGIPRLDDLVGGGLLERSVTLVSGSAGVGKSTFGLQFLLAGAVSGELGLYVALEESPEQVTSSAESMQLDVDPALVDFLTFSREEITSARLIAVLAERIQRTGIRRLVLDSASHLESDGMGREALLRLLYAVTMRLKSSERHECLHARGGVLLLHGFGDRETILARGRQPHCTPLRNDEQHSGRAHPHGRQDAWERARRKLPHLLARKGRHPDRGPSAIRRAPRRAPLAAERSPDSERRRGVPCPRARAGMSRTSTRSARS